MPVPQDWSTSTDNASVRDNSVDGSIKIATITNRGIAVGPEVVQNIQEFLLKVMALEQSVQS